MSRRFGNCRNKWKCKLVGTGRCDEHPDCSRGSKCPFLAKRKCTFYHPPHHFALTNIERRHRSNSTISNDSRDDDYHNGDSRHYNRSRRHSSSRKHKRRHKKTKRKERSTESIIPWKKWEENELILFVEKHRIYEYFSKERVQEIKKTLNRSLKDIKECLLRLRKEGRININNNNKINGSIDRMEVDDEETKINNNNNNNNNNDNNINDGINGLGKCPGSPLMQYIKENNNKITDKLNNNNNNNNKGINVNDFHFGNLLTTNPYFDNNNNNNNNTLHQEMEEKKIEQNGNYNANHNEDDDNMDLSVVNTSNVPALQYENVPALKYEFLCQDDDDDTNNNEIDTIDTEKTENEDINNELIANGMTEDHVDKIIDINRNNNIECNNMNVNAADNGIEREQIITQNVNVEDIEQEKQSVDKIVDEQEIKIEKPSDGILGLEQIETCFEQNHHNALIQGSDYSVQQTKNHEMTTDIIEDIDYSKSNTIDVNIDNEDDMSISIQCNDDKEQNVDNIESEDNYIITDSINNNNNAHNDDHNDNDKDKDDLNRSDTKDNNNNNNNNNNSNRKRKYLEMIEDDENDVDIEEEEEEEEEDEDEEEEQDKNTRIKELEILSLSLTLKDELEKGVELLSNMRVMDDEKNQNKYIKLLQEQIDCIKQSNLKMHQHQNWNSRARIGDIVRARNSRGHIRKKRRK